MVYFWLIIQTMIASLTHIIAKAVVKEIPPLSLTLFRAGIAGIGFWLMICFSRYRKIKIEPSDKLKFFILGLLSVPLNQFAFILGIKYTTPANASLIYAMTPIFALIFSSLLLKEKINFYKVLGVMLSFIGIGIVFAEHGLSLNIEYLKGNMIIIFGAMFWALYSILGKPMIAKYGPLYVTGVAMIVGSLTYLPIGLYDLINLDFSVISFGSYLGVIYLGVGTSILGYFLWYYAIGKIEASKVVIFTNGQPIMTAILGMIIFGNPITLPFLIGGTLVVAGVFIVQLG
ncbi:MAG: EamA family transporter [Candidatus Kryptonium sp.]